MTPRAEMSHAEYFELLKDTDLKYCDCVDYDLFPTLQDSYNSNSYVNGLIQATGGTSRQVLTNYYGGSKPALGSYFGN